METFLAYIPVLVLFLVTARVALTDLGFPPKARVPVSERNRPRPPKVRDYL